MRTYSPSLIRKAMIARRILPSSGLPKGVSTIDSSQLRPPAQKGMRRIGLPNGLELSGPAKTRSHYRAELAGSACPGVLPGLQRDWNEKAGSSETCFIVYDEHTSQRTQGCKRRNRPWLRIACLLSDWTSVTGALTSPFSTRMVN